jgi:hypothetical protein
MLQVPFSPRDFAPPLLSGAATMLFFEFTMLLFRMLESGVPPSPFAPFDEAFSAIAVFETRAVMPRIANQRNFFFMGIVLSIPAQCCHCPGDGEGARLTRSGSIGISPADSTPFVWLPTAETILERASPPLLPAFLLQGKERPEKRVT